MPTELENMPETPMTMRTQQRFLGRILEVARRRGPALVAAGVACTAAALVPACGGGNSVTCGKGTEQQGSQCVASADLGTDGGVASDAGADASGSTGGDAGVGAGGVPSAGGVTGAGGASAGGAAQGGGDAGPQEAVEKMDFAGITTASPANQTPPNAAAAQPDSIRLTWAPASYPARPLASIHYEIFQAQASGKENFAVPIDTAPAGATSFVVQDLTPGKTYYFVVRAVSDTGSAKDTNTVELSATPAFDDSPPDFATGATGATAAGPTSMTVSWSAAKDDHTAAGGIVYLVYWTDTAGGALTLGAVSNPGATSVVVTGLPAAATDYYFRAHAVDAAGNTDTNKVDVRGTTGNDTQPPVFGGCRSVSDISASTATVTWAPALDDTSPVGKLSYTVYASDVPIGKGQSLKGLEVGTFVGADVSGKPVTSGVVTGLNASTLYRFVCRATDEAGNEDNNLVLQSGLTSSDGEPPTFAGVETAVPAATSIDLTWTQGKDNLSLQKDIRYNVYISLTPGGEVYGTPQATSAPGVAGMTVSQSTLIAANPGKNASNTDYYLVVRAQDGAGNVDTNTVELKATTLVSFADDVQPIFTAKCALAGCHSTLDPSVPPQQGQDLELGAALANIINVPAKEGAAFGNMVRVSTDKVLLDSYMYHKVTGTMPFSGSTMPPAISQGGPLEDVQKATLIAWIGQGAQDN